MLFRLLALSALLASAGVSAQTHNHSGTVESGALGDAPAVREFVVTGLRVDAENPPPGSAVGRAGVTMGDAYLHVVYGRPFARGRQVFGGLVGWGQLWSAGAHVTTEMVVTAPVRMGGQDLAAGAYSLFVTPRPERFTVHVNRALGMHLADDYDPALDVLTLDAIPRRLDAPEPALTWAFVPAGDGADLCLRWDRTEACVPVRPAVP